MQTPQYITDFLEWLTGFINYEAVLNKYTSDDHIFSLEPIRDLSKRLGSPEEAVPTVHIAGSKGKGSTAKMLACILDEAVGSPISIYASPHVYDFRERVCTSRGFYDDDVYEKSIQELKEVVARDNLTQVSWHELTTAFGFLCAKNAKTKYSVIETGCGGRLDATNIVNPELAIINRIELEHMALLGDTLEKIAKEKAGIIKPRTPVVVSKQAKESVMKVFRDTAAKLDAPIYLVDDYCQISGLHYENSQMCVNVTGKLWQRPLNLKLKMLGEKQAENAALAALAAKISLPELTESVIERGLAKASLPGRFEQHGRVILDGAHTPTSIEQTLHTLETLYPDQKYNLLFTISAGKDLSHIASLFRERFEKVYLTVSGGTRAADLADIESAFRAAGVDFIANDNYQEAIQVALENTHENEKLLVTGSFYLLSKVMNEL